MAFVKTTSTAAAVALFAMAGAASAATTTFQVGDNTLTANGDDVLTNTALEAGGDSETIDFTASEALTVRDFLLTGNGFNNGQDLMEVIFGVTRADGTRTVSQFNEFRQRSGTNSIGLGDLDGFRLNAGESFSFTYDYTGERRADVDMSFTTAAVPVPAAGGLLLGALGAGGFIARRKKKANA